MRLPRLYFRIRENGAQVFRIDEDLRQGRAGLEPLAVANLRSGEVRAQGGRDLTDGDRAEIEDWLKRRRAVLARRERDGVAETVERLNLTAQWMQSKASDDEVAEHADDLLLAMHDLRSVIVRRRSDADED